MPDNGMKDSTGAPTKKERRALRRAEKEQEHSARARRYFYKRVGTWSAVTVGILAVVGGFAWLGRTAPYENGGSALANVSSAADWVMGNAEAKVTLVEYGDFQCPACAVYHPMLKTLLDDLGGKIRFVYRYFPLQHIHKYAGLAALAAEAAGSQGKFWEMHDMLFEHQREWADARNAEDIFMGYANTLGLDMERFRSDINSSAFKDKIERNYQSGIASGVRGTPTFFLNGKKMQTPRDYNTLRALVVSEINRAQPAK